MHRNLFFPYSLVSWTVTKIFSLGALSRLILTVTWQADWPDQPWLVMTKAHNNWSTGLFFYIWLHISLLFLSLLIYIFTICMICSDVTVYEKVMYCESRVSYFSILKSQLKRKGCRFIVLYSICYRFNYFWMWIFLVSLLSVHLFFSSNWSR